MPDFNVRSDSVNVEQIMEQIRARIREKRGVDYTEEQLRELAAVKLEKFLDPRGLRSDLVDQFRRQRVDADSAVDGDPRVTGCVCQLAAPPDRAIGLLTWRPHRPDLRQVRAQ